MPKLICCLGNPGESYKLTRHNAGFIVGEALIKKHGFSPLGKKFKSLLYQGQIGTQKLYLIFPQTFMNLSGEAVVAAATYYKIPTQDVLIVYDDFDIPFNTVRYREKGSGGTHNGMKSIIQLLGTQDFPRLRIGIGPRSDNQTISDFVLSNFSKTEQKELPSIQDLALATIETLYALK